MAKERRVFLCIVAAVLLIIGAYRIFRERYQFKFDTDNIEYITVSYDDFGEERSKDIYDKKEIQRIVSKLKSLRVYPSKKWEGIAGGEAIGFVFYLKDGSSEEIVYEEIESNRAIINDKEGDTRVSLIDVYRLWERLPAEDYPSPFAILPEEDAGQIASIDCYFAGKKYSISDKETIQKIAKELAGPQPRKDKDTEEKEEEAVDVRLNLEDGRQIGFYYMPKAITTDLLSDWRIEKEFPALKKELREIWNAAYFGY